MRLLLLCTAAAALVTPPRRRQQTLCQAKKKEKKGFDYKPPPKPPAKKAITDDVGVAAATTPEGNSQLLQTLLAEEKDRAQVQTKAMEDLKERDAYVAEKGVEAARVPDAVANRMIMRMATFGGVPVFLGIGVFVWFYFQATSEDNVFQPTAVAAATTVPWVLGLLGIGFGALSASWDEEDEGSALGVDVIKLNVGRLEDGVAPAKHGACARNMRSFWSETRPGPNPHRLRNRPNSRVPLRFSSNSAGRTRPPCRRTAPSAPTRSTRNRIRKRPPPLTPRRRRGAHIPPRTNAFPWV